MGRPVLNRRQLLTGVGGLTVAGSFGFAALGHAASPRGLDRPKATRSSQ